MNQSYSGKNILLSRLFNKILHNKKRKDHSEKVLPELRFHKRKEAYNYELNEAKRNYNPCCKGDASFKNTYLSQDTKTFKKDMHVRCFS